jgi:(2Fe-2S) ferredoxin
MLTNSLPYEKIIFVCTNQREPGERTCCANGGGCALRDKLKEMVKKRQLRSKVRVSQSGCMDQCEDGPNIMVFPDNVWLSHVRESDLEAILEAVAHSLDTGEPVSIKASGE